MFGVQTETTTKGKEGKIFIGKRIENTIDNKTKGNIK